MIAPTEIFAGNAIKRVKKILDEEKDIDNDFNLIKSIIDNCESQIIDYFSHNHTSFEKAYFSLFDTIIKTRFASVDFLLNSEIDFTEVISEDEINDSILDAFESKNILSADLNHSYINTLEFFRDNKAIELLQSLPADVFKAPAKLIASNKVNNIDEFIDILEKLENANYNKDFKKQLGDFLNNSLSIEFVTILYFLLDDNKISFPTERLTELAEFNTAALNKYNEYFPQFTSFIDGEKIKVRTQKTVQLLKNYVEVKQKNTADEKTIELLGNSLNSVIELKDLEKGWDDEESKPINHDYIVSAIKIISHLYMKFNKAPTFVAPTALSGILIEYAENNTRLDIRVGDSKKTFINFFIDNKLSQKALEFNEENLNTLWKINPKK